MTLRDHCIEIRPAERSDYPSIVAVNAAAVRETSPMSLESVAVLAGLACYFKVTVAGKEVAAFLMGLREGMPYDNDNYRWVSGRFRTFLYIDRIVVGSAHTGRRIGSLLYADLFSYARLNGISNVICEYNIEPPNAASAAFHKAMGFKEIGTQWVANRSKRVSLQLMAI